MTHIGPYQLNSIVTGDSKELALALPDESVRLIFTDPIYENLEDYAWLGRLAMRVLKPKSALLAWVSKKNLARAQIAMEDAGLSFIWYLDYTLQAKTNMLHGYRLLPKTTPCLLMAKGTVKANTYMPDWFCDNSPPAHGFKWQKNPLVIKRWMKEFSKVDDIVLDPFCGSGTKLMVAKELGRRFIGFEIDSDRAEEARKRVANTKVINRVFDFKPMKQEKLEMTL